MNIQSKEKRPLIKAPYSFETPKGVDHDSLRQVAKNEPKRFMDLTQQLIDDGEMRMGKLPPLTEFFKRWVDVELPVQAPLLGGEKRTLMASAFPILTSGMMIADVNEAYMGVETIGQELVEERDTNKKTTTIANILSEPVSPKGVAEGDLYPLMKFGDEKFQIGHRRDGVRVQVTAETLEENDQFGIADMMRNLGEYAAEVIEEQTLDRVTDRNGSATSPAEPYVIRQNGVGAALYRTNNTAPFGRLPTSGNRITNNALADTSDLEAARQALAGMKNSRGRRIAFSRQGLTLLVPDALSDVAARILNSEYQPGVENEFNNWGPRGAYRPRLISSPKLDDISSTAWYLGDFKRQFTRVWKLRMELVQLLNSQQLMSEFVNGRIACIMRIGWDCEIGARDYVHVVQCLSGTTAPTAAAAA